MGLENVKCYECHQFGHLAKDCPAVFAAAAASDSRPGWCGQCDRKTRHLVTPDGPQRCPACHPEGRRLRQHRECPRCHQLTTVWDHNPCGSHQPVGKQLEHVKPGSKS